MTAATAPMGEENRSLCLFWYGQVPLEHYALDRNMELHLARSEFQFLIFGYYCAWVGCALVVGIHQHAIEGFRPRSNTKTNAGERAVARRDVDAFVRSLPISPKDDLHRALNWMRDVPAITVVDGKIDFIARRQVIGTDPFKPRVLYCFLFAFSPHHNAGQPAFMLAAEAIEEGDPLFWRYLDTAGFRMRRQISAGEIGLIELVLFHHDISLCSRRKLFPGDRFTMRPGFAVFEERLHADQVFVEHIFRSHTEEFCYSVANCTCRRVIRHQQVNTGAAITGRFEADDSRVADQRTRITSPG